MITNFEIASQAIRPLRMMVNSQSGMISYAIKCWQRSFHSLFSHKARTRSMIVSVPNFNISRVMDMSLKSN